MPVLTEQYRHRFRSSASVGAPGTTGSRSWPVHRPVRPARDDLRLGQDTAAVSLWSVKAHGSVLSGLLGYLDTQPDRSAAASAAQSGSTGQLGDYYLDAVAERRPMNYLGNIASTTWRLACRTGAPSSAHPSPASVCCPESPGRCNLHQQLQRPHPRHHPGRCQRHRESGRPPTGASSSHLVRRVCS